MKRSFSHTESFVAALFSVPVFVLAVALPLSCSSSVLQTQTPRPESRTSVAVVAPEDSRLPTTESLLGVLRKILDEKSDGLLSVASALRDGIERSERLRTKDLTDAYGQTFMLRTERGRGSATPIFCIPILQDLDPAIDSTGTHVPWILFPEEPAPQPKPQIKRVTVVYLVVFLTAKHVVEWEEPVFVLPPRPEASPTPQPEPTEPPTEPPTRPEEPTPPEVVVLWETKRAQRVEIATENDCVLEGASWIYTPTDFYEDNVDNADEYASDIALVGVVSKSSWPTVPLGVAPLKIGDTVYKAGYGGDGEELWISSGIVCDPQEARASVTAIHGDSGGPILTPNGRVVGVLSGIEVVTFVGEPHIVGDHCLFMPTSTLMHTGFFTAALQYYIQPTLALIALADPESAGPIELKVID